MAGALAGLGAAGVRRKPSSHASTSGLMVVGAFFCRNQASKAAAVCLQRKPTGQVQKGAMLEAPASLWLRAILTA